MQRIGTLALAAMAAMTVLSVTGLFGRNLASGAVIIGIAAFFVIKAVHKESSRDSGLDVATVGASLRHKDAWFWMVLALAMSALRVIVARLYVPAYLEHEAARAGAFVAIELTLSSAVQFFVFALGEEIAWRAFFQRQLAKTMPVALALALSSALFTLGHLSAGDPAAVAYGLAFTFAHSIIYGVVFHKTNNAWASALVHFASNMVEVAAMVMLLPK